MISIYWAFIYIIVIDITSSLYLANYASRFYKIPYPQQVTVDVSGQTTGTDNVTGQPVTVDTSGTDTSTIVNYHKFDKESTKYILKMIGIFNLILIITLLLVCIKLYIVIFT
jgi:hypothetical protein